MLSLAHTTHTKLLPTRTDQNSLIVKPYTIFDCFYNTPVAITMFTAVATEARNFLASLAHTLTQFTNNHDRFQSKLPTQS